MTVFTIRTDRRKFLARAARGLSSVAAVQMLGAFTRDAWADAPPRRLVMYVSGSGIEPKIVGENRVASEADFSFTGAFAPLEDIKKDVLFLTGMYNLTHMDQHGNAMAGLTCARDLRDRVGHFNPRPGGPTFDHFLAQKLNASEPFPVVPLGAPADDGALHERCASGVDRVVPSYKNAKIAVDRLFGALRGGQNVGAVATRQKLIVSHVLKDGERVRAQLAGGERVRLEEYMDSLSAYATRLERWARGGTTNACTLPETPVTPTGPRWAILAQQVELVPFVLRCGLSRFVTIAAAPGASNTFFPGHRADGVAYPDTKIDQHNMHHQFLDPAKHVGDPLLTDRVRGVYAYHAANIARLWRQLKAIREGAGTMADNTTILWFSDAGSSHHNGWRNQSAVIVGGNGKLRSQRFLRYPTMTHSMSELFLTLAKALDAPVDKFGDGTDPCRGPLPGALA